MQKRSRQWWQEWWERRVQEADAATRTRRIDYNRRFFKRVARQRGNRLANERDEGGRRVVDILDRHGALLSRPHLDVPTLDEFDEARRRSES